MKVAVLPLLLSLEMRADLCSDGSDRSWTAIPSQPSQVGLEGSRGVAGDRLAQEGPLSSCERDGKRETLFCSCVDVDEQVKAIQNLRSTISSIKDKSSSSKSKTASSGSGQRSQATSPSSQAAQSKAISPSNKHLASRLQDVQKKTLSLLHALSNRVDAVVAERKRSERLKRSKMLSSIRSHLRKQASKGPALVLRSSDLLSDHEVTEACQRCGGAEEGGRGERCEEEE